MNEIQIQRAVFDHYRSRASDGVFMFACPNGGFRRPVEAAIMKSTGVTPGVPDLVAVKSGRAYFLELKTEKGRLSDAQRITLEALENSGAVCEVAYGLDPALAWLEAQGLLRGRAA